MMKFNLSDALLTKLKRGENGADDADDQYDNGVIDYSSSEGENIDY